MPPSSRRPLWVLVLELMAASVVDDASSSGGCVLALKVILVGEPGVGKSSLPRRFTDDAFTPLHHPTIGADFGQGVVCLPAAGRVRLRVWDIVGAERRHSPGRIFFRAADAAIVCYDVTDAASLRHASAWAEEVRRHSDPATPMLLLGCKSDLPRAVDHAHADAVAAADGMLVGEASSLSGDGVVLAFQRVADVAVRGAPRDGVATGGRAAVRLQAADPARVPHADRSCAC